jgi:hypothetical protein
MMIPHCRFTPPWKVPGTSQPHCHNGAGMIRRIEKSIDLIAIGTRDLRECSTTTLTGMYRHVRVLPPVDVLPIRLSSFVSCRLPHLLCQH